MYIWGGKGTGSQYAALASLELCKVCAGFKLALIILPQPLSAKITGMHHNALLKIICNHAPGCKKDG